MYFHITKKQFINFNLISILCFSLLIDLFFTVNLLFIDILLSKHIIKLFYLHNSNYKLIFNINYTI